MKNKSISIVLYAREAEPRITRETSIDIFKDKYDLHLFDKTQPVIDQFKGADVVLDIGGWGSREMIDAATSCQLWQIVGTGTDHANVDYMQSKGIRVANCPGETSCLGLAECVMMYILMLSRHFNESQSKLINEKKMYQPCGFTLDGLTLGIIGFGASGRDLARRARSFGMRLQVIEKYPVPEAVLREINPDFMGTPDDLDAVIPEADFVSLHVPLIDETHHLIDARRLALMKPTACLINVARGAIVDEEALYQALLAGKLGGAGLDVFSQEPPDLSHDVFKLPNVIVTPHIAGNTDHTWRQRAKVALENVDRIAQGLEPLHRVDNLKPAKTAEPLIIR